MVPHKYSNSVLELLRHSSLMEEQQDGDRLATARPRVVLAGGKRQCAAASMRVHWDVSVTTLHHGEGAVTVDSM